MDRQSTEEVLIEFGIHLGYEGPRRDLARDLEKGSLTGLDLRMVCDHVRDSGTPRSAGARISAVLSDKDRWGPLLADLRKFHAYRGRKDTKMAKRKMEPGKGLRDQDRSNTAQETATYYGLGPEELLEFRWRWTVADWMHRGHSEDSLEKFMDATRAEIRDCVSRFPKGQSFEEALAAYTDKKKGNDAGKPGSD